MAKTTITADIGSVHNLSGQYDVSTGRAVDLLAQVAVAVAAIATAQIGTLTTAQVGSLTAVTVALGKVSVALGNDVCVSYDPAQASTNSKLRTAMAAIASSTNDIPD